MNNKHMPMQFTEGEKPLAQKYLKKFKHSPLCLKMLMCSYYANKYKTGFITPKYYLELSVRVMGGDRELAQFWNLDKTYKSKFFGFTTDIILNGTVNDVECMIIRDCKI